MKISVIGTGYLGATHAAAMARLGHDVLGIDVDPAKVASLQEGRVPFHEPELPELLVEELATGRLRFTTDYAEVGAFADVHFVCVGTPQKKGEYAADMRFVRESVAALVPHLKAGSLVVGKSTVPVGTAAKLAESIEAADCDLAWNPEFLREGHAVHDTLTPDRMVFGVKNERSEKVLRELYHDIIALGTPVIVTDMPTAELVKVSANAFLATKISFINAISEVCEVVGADIMQLADAIGHDDRIGRKFLNAGIGFGGGCLPKDIRAFMARAGELGVDQALTFLREVDAINVRRRARTVDLAREMCGGTLAGMRVGVLGAAFKPDSDDIRDSPALDIAFAIQQGGAAVRVYDPYAMDNARIAFPTLAYGASAIDACQGADVVLHLTEWKEFKNMHPSALSEVVAERRIIDGRNTLDRELWSREGWTHRALGRTSI